MPHEEARDFFYSRSNYIHELDSPAEVLAEQMSSRHPSATAAISDRLRRQHGVRLVARDQDQLGALHRFDPDTRVLALANHLRPEQRAFKLAGQLAFMEYSDVLQQVADDAGLPAGETRSLVIIGLANYFAAALLLPYEPFRAAAENLRYDLERLVSRFGASFETVCHRLSTLQRPRARGVPFSLVRVDRAGNVSKMLSSTSFHFSRSADTRSGDLPKVPIGSGGRPTLGYSRRSS